MLALEGLWQCDVIDMPGLPIPQELYLLSLLDHSAHLKIMDYLSYGFCG